MILAAIFFVPPALALPLLDPLDRRQNFTLGYHMFRAQTFLNTLYPLGNREKRGQYFPVPPRLEISLHREFQAERLGICPTFRLPTPLVHRLTGAHPLRRRLRQPISPEPPPSTSTSLYCLRAPPAGSDANHKLQKTFSRTSTCKAHRSSKTPHGANAARPGGHEEHHRQVSGQKPQSHRHHRPSGHQAYGESQLLGANNRALPRSSA